MKACYYALCCLAFISGILEVNCAGSEVKISFENSTATDQESVKLLFGENHGISWTDLANKDRSPPILARRYFEVYSVDYHYRRELIFFTGGGAIWRLPLNETGAEELVPEWRAVGAGAGAATLAVDWERDWVYYTAPADGAVRRVRLEHGEAEGSGEVVIEHAGNLTMTTNVAVDPYARYLFVATRSGYILRSGLEGQNHVRIQHDAELTNLALDIHSRRVYINGMRDFTPCLRSSDYDGKGVIEYRLHEGSIGWFRLVSVDVFSADGGGEGPQLFWVHLGWRDRDTVWQVNASSRDGRLSWHKEYTSRGTVLDPEVKILCVKVCHPGMQSRPKYWDIELSRAPTDVTDSSASSSSGKWLLSQALSFLVLSTVYL